MIKRIFLIIFFIFTVFFINSISTEEANAQNRISFCNTYDGSCKFSCGDFTYDSFRTAITANNQTGNCVGRATKFKITIRKLELGTSSGYSATGDNARCEIFNGTLISDIGIASPNQILSNKPLRFNKCKEVIYDRIYVTIDRKMVFAANATFPTVGTGGVRGSYIARTTSACAIDSLSLSVTALGWFDSNKDNSGTQCYVRSTQKSNSSDVFIKTKASALGGEADYSSMTSNIDNDYDDFKSVYLDAIGGDTSATADLLTNDPTFYDPGGLGGFEGEKIDPTDSTREIMVFIKGSDVITGSGFAAKFDKKKTHSLELNYFAGDQTKGYGARFLFKRVDTLGVTDVKIMGARPDDNGLFITFNQY